MVTTTYKADEREGPRGRYWAIVKVTECEHGLLSRELQATVLVWEGRIVDDIMKVLNERAKDNG